MLLFNYTNRDIKIIVKVTPLIKQIENILQELDKLDYFTPWREILLGNKALNYWKKLLFEDKDTELCREVGEFFDLNNVPFVIVREYIDSFFRYGTEYLDKKYAIQDSIAKAYIIRKLENDSKSIQNELDKKLLVTLEKNRGLINAHLIWMQSFIARVKGEKISLELDPTCCTVGKWLLQNKNNPAFDQINEKHSYLHSLAQSSLRMYDKKEYAFFLLPYMDIVSYSYAIRDILLHFYFVEHLDSIYIDPLSDLPNYLQLSHAVEEYDDTMSLFVFNIHEFSKINLVHGHKKANKIIKDVARYLKSRLGKRLAYRIYADEFAIILPTQGRDDVIRGLKEGIEAYLFEIDEYEISIKIYGSVAKLGKNILELCEYGLIASHQQYGFVVNADKIDKKQLQKFASSISFQQKLRLAFLDNRIKLYYQPILNLEQNKIQKYEVLMRIEDDTGEIRTPSFFLDTLKKMYIYPEVTKLIIQKSFAFFKEKSYAFSINLNYTDIINQDIKTFIVTILKDNPEIAKRCIFELIENEAFLNLEEINEFIVMTHSYGVKIAIDDFGSGYSNYDLIFNLDIDYIKIDGSLIKNLLLDHKSEIIVESLVTLAREKGAKVVAEWVSDEALFHKVQEMGIDFAQGYYIGKPSNSLITGPLTISTKS